MKKLILLTSMAAATSLSAQITWQGADLADYGTGTNWVGGTAPTNGGSDNILIDNGTRADWQPGGDFVSNGTFTATGAGSGWTTNDGNWSRFNGTVNVLNGASIDRNNGNPLVFGSNDVTGTTVTLNVDGGSVETDGELWFGWSGAGDQNTIVVNIGGGASLLSNGGGGASIFIWDTTTFNFTGAGTITAAAAGVEVGDGRVTTNWETMWASGSLTYNGLSGLDGETFSDFFSTTGTNGTDTYTLTAVPEPSSYALLAGILGLGYVMTRRRK